MPGARNDDGQIDRFMALAQELGCDGNEATFDDALMKLAKAAPLPKHEPKTRAPKLDAQR